MRHIDLRRTNAPSLIADTERFFASEQEVANDRREVVIDPAERTPDGMVELGLVHLELRRDLQREWMSLAADWPRERIEQMAEPRLARINQDRREPIDIHSVNKNMLYYLAEPHWAELGDDELADYPDYLQEYAEEFREVDAKLAELSQDEELREAALAQYGEKLHISKVAHSVILAKRRKEALAGQIADVYERAARSGRGLNRADTARVQRLEQQVAAIRKYDAMATLRPEQKDEFNNEHNRLARRINRRELQNGLLLTPDMQDHIDKTLPSLVAGRPALFVGETGGAKTALAIAIARQFMGKEPELVSFHGDMTVADMVGKYQLRDGETVYDYGPATRAMEEGRPLIADEINAAGDNPAILKRMNIMMQLRPGDTFTIQEDSGKKIVVQPGFCIIATANEKSSRYKGVDVMSAEFKNRFGVNVRRVDYPDSDVMFGELPADNMALAEAALADDIGEFAVTLPEGQLEAFVKAAHASQKIFSGKYGDGDSAAKLKSFVLSDRLADNKPGLDDTVLSPRLMVAILEQVKDGMGRTKLTDVLADWVKGIEKPGDRAVMTKLLDNYVSADKISLLGNDKSAEPEPAKEAVEPETT